ncbi:MAG: hypothetical protein ACI8QQ_002594 [Psychroserpens sp.]|jgi:hypothetical protein
MKKLVLVILGFLLGALAMYYYCNNNNNNNYQTMNEMKETPTPTGIITPSEIKTLTEAYNPRYDTISETIFRGVPGGDNRSSWYSLEDLRNFLTLAEEQAQDLKYNMDGVRVYLGANPALKNKPGYTTLLFVPTGTPMTSEGNMLNLAIQGGLGGPDIPGGNGLDRGHNGSPPSDNYPQ